MPSLSVALRGLFGSGMARCLERCLEEISAAAHENSGGGGGGAGVTSEPSFRTVGTSGGSIGSAAGVSPAAAARAAARQKVRGYVALGCLPAQAAAVMNGAECDEFDPAPQSPAENSGFVFLKRLDSSL